MSFIEDFSQARQYQLGLDIGKRETVFIRYLSDNRDN